jgi:DNA-directed RNA polymerase alpha subunit
MHLSKLVSCLSLPELHELRRLVEDSISDQESSPTLVCHLNLGIRALAILATAGITTVDQLRTMSVKELAALPGCGKATMLELKEMLHDLSDT